MPTPAKRVRREGSLETDRESSSEENTSPATREGVNHGNYRRSDVKPGKMALGVFTFICSYSFSLFKLEIYN